MYLQARIATRKNNTLRRKLVVCAYYIWCGYPLTSMGGETRKSVSYKMPRQSIHFCFDYSLKQKVCCCIPKCVQYTRRQNVMLIHTCESSASPRSQWSLWPQKTQLRSKVPTLQAKCTTIIFCIIVNYKASYPRGQTNFVINTVKMCDYPFCRVCIE